MDKQDFFSTKRRHASFYPLYIVLAATAIFLILHTGHEKDTILQAGLMIGGFICISAIFKATSINKNLEYLKKNGYYEQMLKEYPGDIGGLYVFTDTFAFSYNTNICLPISRIQTVKTKINRTNDEDMEGIKITVCMDDGERYCFLRNSYANVTAKEKLILEKCAAEFVERNPAIVVKRS